MEEYIYQIRKYLPIEFAEQETNEFVDYLFSAYLENISTENRIDLTTIQNWLQVGEVFLKYRDELEMIGFTDTDSPTKLRYLERALLIRDKQEVFDNIKTMTIAEFINFSKRKRFRFLMRFLMLKHYYNFLL